jgi:hypothetical protein
LQPHQKQQLQSQQKQQVQPQQNQQSLSQQKQQSQSQQTQPQPQEDQQSKAQQDEQLTHELISNNSIAINPVPLANLLKVALSTGIKKFNITHSSNQKLLAVPLTVVSNSIPTNSITFVNSNSHFLMSKNAPTNLQNKSPVNLTTQSPSVIDLDSDDEPVILENNSKTNKNNKDININTSMNINTTNESDNIEASVVNEQVSNLIFKL